jgi:hypothetical protein
MKKNLAIASFVLAAGVFGAWAATGMQSATRIQIPVETVSTDAFGDEVKTTEWKDGFELGLLDGALPAAGGFIGLGAVLLLLHRRQGA